MKRPIPGPRSYPKQIIILDDVWDIRFVRKCEDPENRGECDGITKEIIIIQGMSREETFKTLIHEVIHALEFSGKLEIKHSTVYKLEDVVFSLLMENFYD